MATVIHLDDLGDRGFYIGTRRPRDLLGSSVASAGDVDGDGYDDVMVGAPGSTRGHATWDTGAAYIIYGKAGGFETIDVSRLSPDDGITILGVDPGDHTGVSVSMAGDVNGDGSTDLIVGGDGNSIYRHSDHLGVAHVVFGKPSGLSGVIDLAGLTSSDGFAMRTGEEFDGVGASVSGAGDVNGDGIDDVIVGAPLTGPDDRGEAYVVFGRSDGFGQVDLTHLAPTEGFAVVSSAAAGQIGGSVDTAGDFNGDGYADLLIGDADGGEDGAGATYIVFGKAGGFGTVDVNGLASADGLTIHGARAGDQAGADVALAGDVNGDGHADVIVGAAYVDDAGDRNSGAAYVIFGRAGASGSIDLADLTPDVGFTIAGAAKDGYVGFDVAAAGDVNGDGFDDVILTAARGSEDESPKVGHAYVIFGKAGGFGTVDLGSLSDGGGFAIEGTARSAGFASVSGAGDVNGDGFGDLVVGAIRADYSAGAYVILGTAPTEDVVRIGSVIAQTIHGGLGNDRLEGRGGDDVLIGAEGDDVAEGQGGNDDLQGGDGDDRLVGGNGDDILHGAGGSDRLSGGRGADTLFGGEGKDLLSGGGGADLFHFSLGGTAPDAANADRITDFARAEHDRIDLSDYDADAGTKPVDAFTFVGTAAFSGTAGELRYEIAGGDTLVSGDTDGDRAADFTIRLSGSIALTSDDFLFAAALPLGGAHMFLVQPEAMSSPFLHLA